MGKGRLLGTKEYHTAIKPLSINKSKLVTLLMLERLDFVRKKATKATSKRYEKSNNKNKSLTSNLTKSNQDRVSSRGFCHSVRSGYYSSYSSSNVVEGRSDHLENCIFDKET